MYKQYSLILPILIMIPFLRFDISDFLLIGVCTVLALKRKILVMAFGIMVQFVVLRYFILYDHLFVRIAATVLAMLLIYMIPKAEKRILDYYILWISCLIAAKSIIQPELAYLSLIAGAILAFMMFLKSRYVILIMLPIIFLFFFRFSISPMTLALFASSQAPVIKAEENSYQNENKAFENINGSLSMKAKQTDKANESDTQVLDMLNDIKTKSFLDIFFIGIMMIFFMIIFLTSLKVMPVGKKKTYLSVGSAFLMLVVSITGLLNFNGTLNKLSSDSFAQAHHQASIGSAGKIEDYSEKTEVTDSSSIIKYEKEKQDTKSIIFRYMIVIAAGMVLISILSAAAILKKSVFFFKKQKEPKILNSGEDEYFQSTGTHEIRVYSQHIVKAYHQIRNDYFDSSEDLTPYELLKLNREWKNFSKLTYEYVNITYGMLDVKYTKEEVKDIVDGAITEVDEFFRQKTKNPA